MITHSNILALITARHSLGHFAGLTSAMSQDLFPSSVALILQQALQLMVGESGHSAKATQAHPLTSQRG